MSAPTPKDLRTAADGGTLYKKTVSAVDNVFIFSDTVSNWEIVDSKGPYIARKGGLIPDTLDKSYKLQLILNNANVKEVVFDNGDVVINGTIACGGKKLTFRGDGRITGTGTLDTVTISADYDLNIFAPTITITNPSTHNGVWSAKWNGAKGDNTTDDYPALQKSIDTALNLVSSQSRIQTWFLPTGIYKITNGLVALKDWDNDGFPNFFGLDFAGPGGEIGTDDLHSIGAIIRCTHNDNFAFGIQFGKGNKITNIGFTGTNDCYGLSLSTIFTGLEASFVIGGARNNTVSPYSGIVIDPFHSLQGVNAYPRMTQYYNTLIDTATTGSTGIHIQRCYVNRFVCDIAISPNGHSQNAEACTLENIWVESALVGISVGNSQTRTNLIKDLKCWGAVHTVIHGFKYGTGVGAFPTVEGANIAGGVYRFFATLVNYGHVSIKDCHTELMYQLGTVTGNTGIPCTFTTCNFDMNLSGVFDQAPQYFIGTGNFNGCVMRVYDNARGIIPGYWGFSTFNGCTLSSPPMNYRDISNNINIVMGVANIRMFNCLSYGWPEPGLLAAFDTEYTRSSAHFIDGPVNPRYWVKSATLRNAIFGNVVAPNALPLSYQYELAGDADMVRLISTESTTVNWQHFGTATFTSALVNGFYKSSDMLAISGFSVIPDIDASASSAWLGTVHPFTPYLDATTVQVYNTLRLNNGGASHAAVVALYDFPPLAEPVVGETTSGSPTMINAIWMPTFPGTVGHHFIYSSSFPAATRIETVDFVNKTITFSKNATETNLQAEVIFRKFVGKGTSIQDPNTINYVSLNSTFIPAQDGIILKDSFLKNTGGDPTIDGWLCTKTGYLGSAKPPVFETIAKDSVRTPVTHTTSQTANSSTNTDNVRKLVRLSGSVGAVDYTIDPTVFTNKTFVIKCINAANTVRVVPSSGTIDGSANITLALNDKVHVYSDGTNLFTV